MSGMYKTHNSCPRDLPDLPGDLLSKMLEGLEFDTSTWVTKKKLFILAHAGFVLGKNPTL
jgi:hypothetical protein